MVQGRSQVVDRRGRGNEAAVPQVQLLTEPRDLRPDGLIIGERVPQGLQGLNRRVFILQKVFFDRRLLPERFTRIFGMAVFAAFDDRLKLNDGLIGAAMRDLGIAR